MAKENENEDDLFSDDKFLEDESDDFLNDDSDDVFNNLDDDESDDPLFEDEDENNIDDSDDDLSFEDENDDELLFGNDDDDDFLFTDEDESEAITDEPAEPVEKPKEAVVPPKKETPKKEVAKQKEPLENVNEQLKDEVASKPSKRSKPKKETKPKPEKPAKEKTSGNNGSMIKGIAAAVIVSSALSIGAVFLLSQYNIIGGDDNSNIQEQVREMGITNAELENDLRSAISSLENLNMAVNRTNTVNEQLRAKLEDYEKNKNTVNKFMATVTTMVRENNEIINNLGDTSSNEELINRLQRVESQLGQLDYPKELITEFSNIKTTVENLNTELNTVKQNISLANNELEKIQTEQINLRDKTLDNAQGVTEARKGIRNISLELSGNENIKDILRNDRETAKDVRALSLSYDNDRSVNVDSGGPAYDIIGSIQGEMVFIMQNGEPVSYRIGSFLEGYGNIQEIRENNVIVTSGGIVKDSSM